MFGFAIIMTYLADYYKIDLLEAHIEARNDEIRCLEENGV